MSEIIIRQIQSTDLTRGFLESLDSLRKASDLEVDKAQKILGKIKSNPNHIIFVALENQRVVGSTTLLLEPKFIHKGGLVGHIEDVVVSKNMQGKGIGEKLIQNALNYAKKEGCYKTILDCKEDVREFYEKIGFYKTSYAMRFDH